jgi:hypothetical protein
MSESINVGESVPEPWELLIEKTTIIDLCYLGQLWESKGGRIYSLHVGVMWKQEKKMMIPAHVGTAQQSAPGDLLGNHNLRVDTIKLH